MDEQPFAKEIKSVIPGTNKRSQEKPGIDMLVSRKDLGKALLANGMDPFRRPTSTENQQGF